MTKIVKKKVEVGVISWISERPHPLTMHGFRRLTLNPEWLFDTHVGLIATSNSAPPVMVDFKTYQQTQQYRAMMFCSLEVEADEETDTIISLSVVEAFHDPGWTPPFDPWKVKATLAPALVDKDIKDRNFYPGEAGLGTKIQLQRYHDSSNMKGVVRADQVLVNGVLKFRAGKHTDDLGVKKVGAPFHVPWVWCEFLLAYKGGKIHLFGQGSEFPTHTWYLNGKSVFQVDRVGDTTFPIASSGLLTSEIDVEKMKIYPVLAVGMPAKYPQLQNSINSGPVSTHPHTAKGGVRRTSVLNP